MVDGVVLLVDAKEGVMAQTKYVLSKSLGRSLPSILVLNKIDRDGCAPERVESEVFDLFLGLGAHDNQMEYPALYASAKLGWAVNDFKKDQRKDMTPLLDTIIERIPPPKVNENDKFAMLVTQVESNSYIGKCYLGRVYGGSASTNQAVKVLDESGNEVEKGKISKIFSKSGLGQKELTNARAGDIVLLAGLEKATVNSTICDLECSRALSVCLIFSLAQSTPIDPPTISMTFGVNDSPLAGQEGKLLTSSMIKERLLKEIETNVALRVEPAGETQFKVSGRGELQLGVLIETMRREGFELSISPPRVVYSRDADGNVLEPIEEVVVDVDQEYAGVVIQKLAQRKGELKEMNEVAGKARLIFQVPTRGLLGFISEFKNDTRGTGVLNHLLSHYEVHQGPLERNRKGSLVASTSGQATAFALQGLEPRGTMFISPGTKVYEGMVIGEHNRETDLDVNPVRAKQLSNVRATNKEDAIKTIPPREMSLEETLTFVLEDELVEVTPMSVRIRKKELSGSKRQSSRRRAKNELIE